MREQKLRWWRPPHTWNAVHVSPVENSPEDEFKAFALKEFCRCNAPMFKQPDPDGDYLSPEVRAEVNALLYLLEDDEHE